MFRGHLHCGLLVSKHVDWVLRHLEGLVLFGRWPSIIDCSWKIPLVFFGGVVVNVVVILSEVVCWFYFGVFFCVKGMSIFPCSCSVGWVFHGIPQPNRCQSNHNHFSLPEKGPGRCNATGGQLAYENTVALIVTYSRWWFQICFIFTPTWGRFPCWLIFFKEVETTNYYL